MSSGRVSCFSGHRGVVTPNHDINMNATQPVISRRQKTAEPNHHLWNNHGTWWFHGTLHLPDYTARRIRCNLGTSDVNHACRLRDDILACRRDLPVGPLDLRQQNGT